jgi:hypothetical protein
MNKALGNVPFGVLAVCSVFVLVGCGGDTPRPGARSTVTAYEPDGTTVIKFEACPRIGRTYDYPACGRKLREEVASLMCTRGPGAHSWLYRIGTSSPLPETTRCK